MYRWEYASFSSWSKWLEYEKTYEWQIKIAAGPEATVLVDETESGPSILKWSNWLGNHGWEMVGTDISKRAFTSDDKSEAYPARYLFYFRRPILPQPQR